MANTQIFVFVCTHCTCQELSWVSQKKSRYGYNTIFCLSLYTLHMLLSLSLYLSFVDQTKAQTEKIQVTEKVCTSLQRVTTIASSMLILVPGRPMTIPWSAAHLRMQFWRFSLSSRVILPALSKSSNWFAISSSWFGNWQLARFKTRTRHRRREMRKAIWNTKLFRITLLT